MRLPMRWQKFSKALYILTLNSPCTRTLTFDNFCQELLPEGEDIGPVRNREYPTESEDRAAHNAGMRAQTVDCDGRKAEFVLKHWDKFAPFISPEHRAHDSSLALKLRRAADQMHALESNRMGSGSKARIPVHRQPDCIKNGEMHNYQLEGLKWMVAQHDKGAGGILGDEMGLGKTLQVISLLGFLKYVRGEDGPHIVVAPLSVMNNWVMEIRKWCPELRCVAFHGPQTERDRIKREQLILGHFDVMATTYEMLVADTHTCQRFHWGYIVLDEAHRIKNEKTLMGQAVRRLRSSQRLLITGTPLQNNMHELWSLLNFLYPEVLANADTFDKEWKDKDKSGEADADEEVDGGDSAEAKEGNSENPLNQSLLSAAHALLSPLMLRRLKKDVLTSMQIPPKTELKIFVPLTEMQRFWYSGMLSGECASLAAAGSSDAYRRLNSLVMQLRKVCNHPYLFDEADANTHWTDEDIVKASGKMMVLDKLLQKLKAEGRKVLIFSQFTSMLHVLSDFLNLRRYKFLRLDGSTSVARRRYEIACFQNPKSDFLAYLISTRAGGLGINLTAADTVVLYDSDWNPAIDSQAQDRAHRVGQTRPVHVYRLITRHTVEQRILQVAQNKSCINAAVMQDGGEGGDLGGPKGMSMAEMVKMIEFGMKCIVAGNDGKEVKKLEESTFDEIAARATKENEDEKLEMQAELVSASAGGGDGNGSAAQVKAEEAEAEAEGAGGKTQDASALQELLKGMSSFRGAAAGGAKNAKDVQKALAKEWADRFGGDGLGKRQAQSRTVKIDGHDVLRWSVEEEVRAEEKDKQHAKDRAARNEAKAANKFKHQSFCMVCHRSEGCAASLDDPAPHSFAEPELACVRCPTRMHLDCTHGWSFVTLKQEGPDARKKAAGGWICPHHRCRTCWRTAHEAGGLLFRCVDCPTSLCEECLPDGFEPVSWHKYYGKLNYTLPRSFETIRCAKCAQTAEARGRVGREVKKHLKKCPRWRKGDGDGDRASHVHLDEQFPVTMRFKLSLGGGEASSGKGRKSKAKVKEDAGDSAARASPVTTAALSGGFEERLVEVLSAGEWWRAKIIKDEGGRMLVHYDGGTAEEDEWIEHADADARIRQPEPEQVEVWSQGLAVYVTGRLMESSKGWGRVEFDGGEDEWMPLGSSRLRRQDELAAEEAAAAAPAATDAAAGKKGKGKEKEKGATGGEGGRHGRVTDGDTDGKKRKRDEPVLESRECPGETREEKARRKEAKRLRKAEVFPPEIFKSCIKACMYVSCLILTMSITVHVQAANQRAEDGGEAGAADGDKDRESKKANGH